MTIPNINWALQPESLRAWQEKYALIDKQNNLLEHTADQTAERVATALATNEHNSAKWQKEFLAAIRAGAIPAGRIMANAGARDYKPTTSLINCVVSDTILDNRQSIMDRLKDGCLSLSANCGIGYDFSTLRPRGAPVTGGNAYSSGPVSFMDIYSQMAATISSAGGRRGAQMATFSITHPDVEEFITAKTETGRLRQFNCSVLITREFIDAVNADAPWPLYFPVAEHEHSQDNIEILYKPWPITDGYITDHNGHVACKIYKTLPARDLMDIIAATNYHYDEPGYILIDEINEKNNLFFAETIRATNPCGEQALPPLGACLLGSINLSRFIDHPFTARACLNTDRLTEVTHTFSRLLDNVVEHANLPLPAQQRELEQKRRHGMGIMGYDTALAMLGLPYGSPESIATIETALATITSTGWLTAAELAKEKGQAPILDQTITLDTRLATHYNLTKGAKVPALDLWLKSKYFKQLSQNGHITDDILNNLSQHGSRYTHQTSIAPTGTIALAFGNNCSSGIEPTFADKQIRNVIVPGKKTKESRLIYSPAFQAHDDATTLATPDNSVIHPPERQDVNTIAYQDHLAVQQAAQPFIDSSISKTINLDPDTPIDAYRRIYTDAAKLGLKGCTLYRRDKDTSIGTVLTTPDSLANTTIHFHLNDNTTLQCQGSDTIEYDGELHNAHNLAEAIKENYYGKI